MKKKRKFLSLLLSVYLVTALLPAAALADSSELCEGSSICWVPPQPSEMYTPDRVEIINAAIAGTKAKLDSVTDEQKARMENQFTLWNKARFAIDNY